MLMQASALVGVPPLVIPPLVAILGFEISTESLVSLNKVFVPIRILACLLSGADYLTGTAAREAEDRCRWSLRSPQAR